MGINQAIYTSSARGISKGGGLGIHAYNRLCSELELNEFEQSFCQYHYEGESSKIANLPSKMLFKKIEGQRYMQSAVTYLGKDYDKERGRMGNLLSHMYSFEKKDIRTYPMRLYGSKDFRSDMNPDEVDGSREVSYLAKVEEVHPGNVVTIETVQKFLEKRSWRTDFLCHLMAAVLSIDSIHKVIIYDTHENIVMWLAAIEYALPLQCAVEISFSSYESNPMTSEFDIRGAVPGLSKGNWHEYAEGGQFYVFNGIDIKYPLFDISADYFQDGIQSCMPYAYESLQGFHKFMEKYNYQKPNLDLCAAFQLFQMMQNGMDVLAENDFEQAVSFESKYGGKESYQSILIEMLEKLEKFPDDEGLLKSVYIWLNGYFRKNLDLKEWKYAVSNVMKLERRYHSMPGIVKEKKQIWEIIYQTSVEREMLEFFTDKLSFGGLYQQLGELSAYLLGVLKKEAVDKNIEKLFKRFWRSEPKNIYSYFDLAVNKAATILQEVEEEVKYSKALSIFLKLQDIGEGEIAGLGMDRILCIISDGTNLNNLRLRKSGILHRKKEEFEALEKMQAKCAFEAFNYVQKHHKDLSIVKIRLLHLGRCILNAYEEEKPLLNYKTLAVYSKYPVEMEQISEEEFESYVYKLSETIFSMENSKEDYIQLMTYWILNEKQKDFLIKLFLTDELEYVKKKDDVKGLAAFLEAVKELKDEEYSESLVNTVVELRSSQQEKVAEIIGRKMGKENNTYQYWKEMGSDYCKSGKEQKKRSFPFRIH